jgi:hypothetical protein
MRGNRVGKKTKVGQMYQFRNKIKLGLGRHPGPFLIRTL